MTCIVAIGDGAKIWMGSDGIRHNDRDQVARLTEPKIFERKLGGERIAIGVTGAMVMGQLIRNDWDPSPELAHSESEAVMWDIRADLWKFLHTAPHNRIVCDDGGEGSIRGELIFGFRGWVWSMDSDGALGRHERNYHAIGSGEEYALGSLHTSGFIGTRTADDRIKMALEAAEWHLSSIQGPYHWVRC